MGYIDGLVEGLFKTTTDGTVTFYPNGIFRKGYVIPTLGKKQEMQRTIKRLLLTSTFFSILLVAGVSISLAVLPAPWRWLAGMLWLILLVGMIFFLNRKSSDLIKGLDQSDTRSSVFESLSNTAQKQNVIVLLLLELLFCVSIFTGFQMVLHPQYVPGFFIPAGIFTIIFFGLGSIMYGYMIFVKIKKFISKK